MKGDLIHEGLTWRDMPGQGEDNKRMNFSLFRRGKLSKANVLAASKERAKLNLFGSLVGDKAPRKKQPKRRGMEAFED